jgi:predicted nuclease of predicted toxin-antitoxin system
MRFLLDENLSPQLANVFKACGHDAICVYEAGLGGKSDEKIRACAIQQERILITLDADFADLMRYPVAETPGVIWLKPVSPVTLKGIENQLQAALIYLQNSDVKGRLIVVDQKRIRSRSGI